MYEMHHCHCVVAIKMVYNFNCTPPSARRKIYDWSKQEEGLSPGGAMGITAKSNLELKVTTSLS